MTIGRHTAIELDPSLDDYQLASALVREAGQLALLMRMGGLQGERKTSVSDVVTAADRAAEAYVLEQLRRCRPDDGILGEEGASVAGTSGRTWVIDPVDGTYNFLHGSTYWCSAIALKRNDSDHGGNAVADPSVILGAIYQPETDKLWLGGEEQSGLIGILILAAWVAVLWRWVYLPGKQAGRTPITASEVIVSTPVAS